MNTQTSASKIVSQIAEVQWKQMGRNGKLPQITPEKIRQWRLDLDVDDVDIKSHMEIGIDPETALRQTPEEPEPNDWHLKMLYRIRRCRLQHEIDVPTRGYNLAEIRDSPGDPESEIRVEKRPLSRDMKEILSDENILYLVFENLEEIKPRTTAYIASMAVLCRWENDPNIRHLMQALGISSLEDGIVAIHTLWEAVNKKHKKKFRHPIVPLVRAYLQETTAKAITPEWDEKHPVGILTYPLGSNVREIHFVNDETARLREFTSPESIQQVLQMELFQTESLLPNVVPLDVVHPDNRHTTTKKGAVSHTLRIFFEALMALAPNQRQADLVFTLGDLISYLYPNGKFHRTNQLPYIIDALDILHFYATVPFKEDDKGNIGHWRPVVVRTRLTPSDRNDKKIFLDVKMPPDATQGILIEKQRLRELGQVSAPKYSAYLSACYLFDKYGTQNGGIIDPTRPIERRNTAGLLVDANGNELYASDGKRIKNLYHPDAIAQLPREDNPQRTQYPSLQNSDLIKACGLQTLKPQKVALARARKYWTELERDGIVRIERLGDGWRIMPSENHIQVYRGVKKIGAK